MRDQSAAGLTLKKKLVLGTAGMAALAAPIAMGILYAPAIRAQEAADWQKAAGGKMAFEVASVKPSSGKLVPAPSDYPLTTADDYHPNGGRFRADLSLWRFIQFAYKIWPAEEQAQETLAHLPKWIVTDSYSIDARAAGNPTKDQMRLMVQSLLADRFRLKVHFETHEASVQALTLIQPGKLGPKLRLHSDGPPCDDSGAWQSIRSPAPHALPKPGRKNVGRACVAADDFGREDHLHVLVLPPLGSTIRNHLHVLFLCQKIARGHGSIRRDSGSDDDHLLGARIQNPGDDAIILEERGIGVPEMNCPVPPVGILLILDVMDVGFAVMHIPVPKVSVHAHDPLIVETAHKNIGRFPQIGKRDQP
jgi:hypothetical protein